ncbi:MAG TPA: GAF domain-containing SpoIIE family protein phosphatase, partial [Gemmatimonadaceae bacterium]|nr:GAF domain-containing SpoIIE family protein phosphatase [Gemmatimonadaceae bacterium]
MKELDSVLVAFRESTRCDAAVWTARTATPAELALLSSSGPRAVPPDSLPDSGSLVPLRTSNGAMVVAAVPGVKRTWVTVSPCEPDRPPAENHLRMLIPVVTQILRGAQEVEHAALELAERYEEINLLYTIGEILGRTVTLEEAATTILTEISETVGARHASILVHESGTDMLHVVAAIGTDARTAEPIRIDDPDCVSSRVFRTHHPLTVEEGVMECEAERPYRRGEMLSVPIMWTTPSGGEPLGVVNLSDRRSHQPYSAGDQKLVAAIATQIGTAIQNARLVRASIEQQRLLQEMYLAHDLQMKLLPKPTIVSPEAEVDARVIPAESVGGDFYHLFRMPQNRTGVMVGDVSGHGYRAALIMALAMSASAIHAQSSRDPGEMLAMLHTSLREELSSTEMYISVFFGVIDHRAGKLRYANTGHPHAFRLNAEGTFHRLSADAPPLGLSDAVPAAETVSWQKGKDRLILFTDGIVDSRNSSGDRLGEAAVLDVVLRNRTQRPAGIVDSVFNLLREHSGDVPSPDDLT